MLSQNFVFDLTMTIKMGICYTPHSRKTELKMNGNSVLLIYIHKCPILSVLEFNVEKSLCIVSSTELLHFFLLETVGNFCNLRIFIHFELHLLWFKVQCMVFEFKCMLLIMNRPLIDMVLINIFHYINRYK